MREGETESSIELIDHSSFRFVFFYFVSVKGSFLSIFRVDAKYLIDVDQQIG